MSPEHVCSILASLLRNLRAQQRTRLLNKFTENDSEKVDRLMELYFKYLDAMQVADKKIEGEKHDMVRRGEIIDDDMEEEFYLRRLDAGLFVLQLICYIMAEISNASIPQIRQRVHQILNMRGSSIKIVRHIIKGEPQGGREGGREAPPPGLHSPGQGPGWPSLGGEGGLGVRLSHQRRCKASSNGGS
ncbi:beta-catenin-like 1 [Crotalus adamanteus]|uniref:Beta-catenin-like protein 1 n=1 Tax=Crotalus adamanteus TaxID=8729 RepID=A0AAW1BSS3_CROAD